MKQIVRVPNILWFMLTYTYFHLVQENFLPSLNLSLRMRRLIEVTNSKFDIIFGTYLISPMSKISRKWFGIWWEVVELIIHPLRVLKLGEGAIFLRIFEVFKSDNIFNWLIEIQLLTGTWKDDSSWIAIDYEVHSYLTEYEYR